jgi:hypothetical protein
MTLSKPLVILLPDEDIAAVYKNNVEPIKRVRLWYRTRL